MDPLDWSPDGRYLLYREQNPGTGWDLFVLPLQGEPTPIPLLQTRLGECGARFSPDGRWVAFHAGPNDNALEVFVQAFSGDGKVGLTGSRVQVSNGGTNPLWSADGKELYYYSLATRMVIGGPGCIHRTAHRPPLAPPEYFARA